MQLRATVHRQFTVPAALHAVYAVLADVPDSTAHFPGLESLIAEHGGYTWTLEPTGLKGVQVQLSYGCRYVHVPDRSITWTAIDGVGNAKVSGAWRLSEAGSGCQIDLENHLALEVPIPRLLRPLAQPFLDRQLGAQIDSYVSNLSATFSGGDGRLRLPFR